MYLSVLRKLWKCLFESLERALFNKYHNTIKYIYFWQGMLRWLTKRLFTKRKSAQSYYNAWQIRMWLLPFASSIYNRFTQYLHKMCWAFIMCSLRLRLFNRRFIRIKCLLTSHWFYLSSRVNIISLRIPSAMIITSLVDNSSFIVTLTHTTD